ncbi:hypothetical protein EV714DRAFT_270366 [Schizophyllum commune]
MSRHRDIRNLNIHDELDDDFEEEAEEEMTEEQQALMEDGLIQVREVVGSEEQSGLADNKIKDALWEFYFDIDKTIRWCMEEQDRMKAAQERKDPTADYDKDLPIIPPPVVNPIEARVPLIVLARSQNIYGNPEDYAKDEQGEYTERESGDYGEYENSYDSTTDSLSQPMKRPLSRITELTERTEGSPLVPSRQHAQRETFGSESMSSLGQIIEHQDFRTPEGTPVMDPNQIPVSPSGSALHRLSFYEPAPSMHSSVTASPPPRPPSVDVPPMDSMPDIPDIMSRSSRPAEHNGRQPPSIASRLHPSSASAPHKAPSPAPPKTPSVASQAPSSATSSTAPKKSKLSQLASSRASSSARSAVSAVSAGARSVGARSGVSEGARSAASEARSAVSARSSVSSNVAGETLDGSVRTYPALRPTSSSLRSPTTSTAGRTPEPSEAPGSPAPTHTSMSSHVRKAIEAAMAQEEHDDQKSWSSPKSPGRESSRSTPKPPSSIHSDATARTPTPKAHDAVVATEQKQPSKLALLAKAKAAKGSSILNAPVARKAPALPDEHTEYLTPIANGPTVTTAITTSYQSLYSLASPDRVRMGKTPYVAPLPSPGQAPRPLFGSDKPEKKSKLALKAKKAAQERRPQIEAAPPQLQSPLDDEPMLMRPPIFGSPKEGSRASPSTFGSLLVDPEEAKRRKRKEDKKRAEGTASPFSDEDSSASKEKHRRKSKKHTPPVPTFSPPLGFSFDSPSPDDVVMSARKHTGYAKRQSSSVATSSPLSTSTATSVAV